MKRLTQTLPVFLAAALQLMPLLRNLFINPATGNTLAFILRWGIGSAAALETVDAVSGASTPVHFTSPTNFVGTNGLYFSNSIVVSLVGSGNPADPSDGFVLTNLLNTAIVSPEFIDGQSTTTAMPPGLKMKCVATAGANYIYGVMTGTNTAAGNYAISVTCYGNGGANWITTNVYFTILSASSGSPPAITSQPIVGATNLVGTSNNLFSVAATGTPAPVYQWYFNTNTALPNATNATLTLTNIQLTNAGYYRCTITNSAGSTNSANALLTVWQPPTITNQPIIGATNLVGSTNTLFNVVSGGTPAPTYQWYFNTNTALLNQTNTSLTLTNIQLTNAGYYRCTIINSAGITNSANALLTVWQPPNITNGPVGFTNVAGGSGSLGVIAGGFPAIAYQWRITTNLITTSLASGTNASLSFTNLRACQTGAYTVILTNNAGSVTSAIANVVVTNPAPPVAGGSVHPGSQFQFTFTPVAGLTNTVLTNGLLAGGNWGVFTNYPPTATPTPITITNNLGTGSLFYRLLVVP